MNRKDPKGLLLHTKINDIEELQQRTKYLHKQFEAPSKRINGLRTGTWYIIIYIQKRHRIVLIRNNYLHKGNLGVPSKEKRSKNRNLVHNYIHKYMVLNRT